MRGYGRVEENLDEYESDGVDEYEDTDGDEYGRAEEPEREEDPMPTREEQEYLELRQKLKEEARKKLAKQSGSGSNARDSKRSKLDNFGSFFGPSRPVIAERVIQESKSFLETRQEMPRASSSQKEIRKGPVSGTSAPKNGMTERRPHNPVKTKVENIKNTRDYSFLLSEDAEVPRAANVPPARGAVSVQVPLKSKESGQAGRQLPNGTGERRPAAANSHIRPGQNSLRKPPPNIRSDSRRPDRVAVPEHKKHYPVSGHGNGTLRPALPKGAPSTKKESYPKKVPSHLERKVAGASTERKGPPLSTLKKPSVAVARVAMANGQRPVLKSQTSVRQQSEERLIQGSKGKFLPKQSSSSLKPQMKAPKQIPPRFSREEDLYRSRQQLQPQLKPKPKPKPKPCRRFPGEDDDDQDAFSELRKILNAGRSGRKTYDPSMFAGDSGDDSDMEADFHTIQMEERRSAKIAKLEDEEEWRKIQEEEEEERERKRRLAKRKMEQR